MPESDCTIASASGESGEGWLVPEGFSLFSVAEADSELLIDHLDIVDRSVVRHESSNDLNLQRLFDVPHKHHLIAVNCDDPMPLLITDDCKDI